VKPVLAFAWLVAAAALAWGQSSDSAVAPDGRVAIQDGDNPFLIDAASGKKLAPLLPQWAQGQVTQVSVEAHWSPDSRYLAALISYGSKGSMTRVFFVQNGHVSLVHFDEPDPETIFKTQMGEEYGEAAAGDPLDSVGPWLSNHQVKLVYAVEKDAADGSSKCFSISSNLVLTGATGRLESEQRSIYKPQP
jgi:hypothetical protein